jgi:hypothetical protein
MPSIDPEYREIIGSFILDRTVSVIEPTQGDDGQK